MKQFTPAQVIVYTLILMAVITFGCEKEEDTEEPAKTMVRLKTGSGLAEGTVVNFLALSRFRDFSKEYDPMHYNKYDADWYIDGGVAPFTTAYKEWSQPVGVCYYLISCTHFCQMGEVSIDPGYNTITVTGNAFH